VFDVPVFTDSGEWFDALDVVSIAIGHGFGVVLSGACPQSRNSGLAGSKMAVGFCGCQWFVFDQLVVFVI
jgi:hypothetical protein